MRVNQKIVQPLRNTPAKRFKKFKTFKTFKSSKVVPYHFVA